MRKWNIKLYLHRIVIFFLFILPFSLSNTIGEYISKIIIGLSIIWLLLVVIFALANRIKKAKSVVYNIIPPIVFMILGILAYYGIYKRVIELVINF